MYLNNRPMFDLLNMVLKFRKLICVTILLFLTNNVLATTEFLRFESSISSYYDELNSGYDASLGLYSGQPFYFDFQIDTSLNALGHSDSTYQDYFAVTYISGSLGNTGITYGETCSFPEGTTTGLFITNSLFIGSSWDWLANPSDESIDTWSVGDQLALMNNSYFSDYIIGTLEMTHRSYSALPAYVPVPATAWLFASGLLGFAGVTKRKYRV
jgi:hypothetical protein